MRSFGLRLVELYFVNFPNPTERVLRLLLVAAGIQSSYGRKDTTHRACFLGNGEYRACHTFAGLVEHEGAAAFVFGAVE